MRIRAASSCICREGSKHAQTALWNGVGTGYYTSVVPLNVSVRLFVCVGFVEDSDAAFEVAVPRGGLVPAGLAGKDQGMARA